MDLLVLALFTKYTFNSQIYDPNNKRYEVPIQTPTVSTQATELDYDINVNTFPFGISVKRKSTNTVMWVKLFIFLLFDALNVVLIWGQYFFECGKLDATKSCFDYGIIIFDIQLTVLMSFDFDLVATTVPIQERHFSINFFVPNVLKCIQGWHLISVVVFCYNSPHYLPKIKKRTSKWQGPNEGRGYVSGRWRLVLYKLEFPS